MLPKLQQLCSLSGSSSFSVAVLGDSGFGDPETFQLTELIASYDPSFVIHTGDVVYDVQDNAGPVEAFELKYFAPMSTFLKRIPLYAVMGNHDVDEATVYEGSPYFLRAFSGFPDANYPSKPLDPTITWYAIARGPFQFIFLNSQSFYGQPGREEQKAFLRQRLSDGRFAHNILIFHIPPVTSGLHTTDGLPVRSDWEPIYRDSTTRLVLSGHDHLYERLAFSGVTHIITGGGSRVLYPVGDIAVESQVVTSRTHFVLLNFSAESIEIQTIAHTGEILDSTIITLDAQ
jgi:3',5'-cyclic AMP phosphodiesterase CpdA